MGFQKDIEAILKMTPKDRQLIMLSATTNIEVMNMAYKFNSVPEELVLNHDSLLVDNIDHHLALIDSKEKMPLLVNLLRKDEDSYVIVFCNTQIQTHLVAEWLTQMGFKAEPISGKLAQNRRTRVMDDFRARKTNILVCTDVAARGLDIKDIQLVINFDLPSEAANYVHRIGRTGRAGKQGKAISFCSYEDCEFLDAIYELIDSKIPKLELTEDDFSKDVCRKPYIDFKTLKVRDNSSKQGTDNKNRKSNNMETRPNTRNERSERKPERNNDRKPTRTIETRNEKRPERKKTFNKAKKKLFTIDSYSLKTAKEEASVFFKIHDKSLLQYNILKTGRKKYFIFGEKLTSYQFEVRPIYKKILLPFFINIIKLAKLRLYVKISYNSSTSLLNINFSGEDEKMLLDNKIEFLEAFDQLAKTYLVNISPDIYRPNTKIYFGQAPKNQRDSSGRNERDNDQNKKRVLDMVKKSIDQISQEKPSMAIGPLDSYQRRLVHQFISDDGRYETTSIGDGRMKKIEISLK
jgi:ATP-dependent RNA helicase RhlE